MTGDWATDVLIVALIVVVILGLCVAAALVWIAALIVAGRVTPARGTHRTNERGNIHG